MAIGYETMRYAIGVANTAIGARALMSYNSGSSNENVAVGYQAMKGNTGPAPLLRNVAVGSRAGTVLYGGTDNTLLGYRAGDNITSGSFNIIIGSSIPAAAATDSNKLNIGNLIYGDLSANKYVGINQAVPAYALHVNGDIAYTGALVDVSDMRRKDNIEPLPPALDKIMALKPVTFVMKADPKKAVEYGFIAQDVQKIYPALVKTASDPEQSLSLNYLGLLAPLVKAMQEQQSIIDDQKRQIDELTEMLEKASSDE